MQYKHIGIDILLLYLHTFKPICILERNKMITNIFKTIKSSYNNLSFRSYDNLDPNLVRYFRTEYGDNWEEALELHLQTKNNKNVKKAA
tara:strand:+ start:240 stop:506 length:267 start_codon:yes stop_codon:yes gene_type:complete